MCGWAASLAPPPLARSHPLVAPSRSTGLPFPLAIPRVPLAPSYDWAVPELPEVEITARLLDEALRGAAVESALAPGVKAMRTFDPPLSALEGRAVEGVRRRGKHLIIDFSSVAGHPAAKPGDRAVEDTPERLSLLLHLMSAGRLQLYDKRAGPRDRTSRLLVRLRLAAGSAKAASERRAAPQAGTRSEAELREEAELRLREFGTRQAAWAKLLPTGELERDETLASLGPEAWPDPPEDLGTLPGAPRPLHAVLRDQHTIAGIGRSWADEILWQARLSPFKRVSELDGQQLHELRAAIVSCLGAAIAHYEQALALPIPDKLPMPLRVHRHEGEPCPRCQTTLLAVHFEDYTIAYCPACQTQGRALKDRRMSRLLK